MDRASNRATLHYLRIISALAFSREADSGLEMILLAKLDRLAIGTILRSKLVFLFNVHSSDRSNEQSGGSAAERMGIDDESDQVT